MSTSAPTPALTASARAERNRQIAAARAAGRTWAEIAAEFSISERTARRAEREHLAASKSDALSVDPAAILRQAVEAHLWGLDALRDLAASADNSSAAVGAVRGRVATARDLVDLLGRAGLLPGPAAWAADIEMRAAASAMADVAQRHGIPAGEVIEELDRRLPALRPATLGTA